MKKALVVLLCLSLIGCSDMSEYFTSQGTGVSCHCEFCPSQEAIEHALEYFHNRSDDKFDYDPTWLLSVVYIEFYQSLASKGMFNSNGEIRLICDVEIQDSPLFHELVHGIIYHRYNAMDRYHTRWYWDEERELTDEYKNLRIYP